MSDLISRQAVEDLIMETDPFWCEGMTRAIFEGVKRLPTIYAVPVVRCADCKHWGMHKRLNIPWCFEMHIDKSEDGYCDIGERCEDIVKRKSETVNAEKRSEEECEDENWYTELDDPKIAERSEE